MTISEGNQGKYAFVWQKYRPVLLSLMMAAKDGTQTYSLSSHEFKDQNLRKTSGFSFVLKVFQSRPVNDFKKNLLAQDLLYVLQHSNKARELTESQTYEFKMDKDFKLTITSEPQSTPEPSGEMDA